MTDELTALLAACTRRHEALDEAAAYSLMRALLDDAIAPADGTAALDVYAARWPTAAETSGFCRALAGDARVLGVPADRSGPVVLPAYEATAADAAPIAALALLLERYGVGALVVATDDARGASAIMRALGIATSPDVEHAEARLAHGVGCVTLDVAAPGLARLLRAGRAHRSLQALSKLIDPFAGAGLRAILPENDDERAWLQRALGGARSAVLLPPAPDTAATAKDIAQMLAGDRPVPAPTLAQLGCCLEAVRGADV